MRSIGTLFIYQLSYWLKKIRKKDAQTAGRVPPTMFMDESSMILNEICSVNSQISYSKEYSSTKCFSLPSPSPVLYHSTTDCLFNSSAFRAQSNLWPSKADQWQAVADNRAAGGGWPVVSAEWTMKRTTCDQTPAFQQCRFLHPLHICIVSEWMNETSTRCEGCCKHARKRYGLQHYHRHYCISVFHQ